MTVLESSSPLYLSSSRADFGLDVADAEVEPERFLRAERGKEGFGASYGSYRSLLVGIGGELGGDVAKGGGDDSNLSDDVVAGEGGARFASNATRKSGSWNNLA